MSDTTWFSDESASRIITASATDVLTVIIDAPRLPVWNPAFTSVVAKLNSSDFTISVRGLLRGTLRYHGHPTGVSMTITLPGLTEDSTWELSEHKGTYASKAPQTLVTHRVRQRGPLAAAIGAQEARRVPAKRLSRLAALLE